MKNVIAEPSHTLLQSTGQLQRALDEYGYFTLFDEESGVERTFTSYEECLEDDFFGEDSEWKRSIGFWRMTPDNYLSASFGVLAFLGIHFFIQ